MLKIAVIVTWLNSDFIDQIAKKYVDGIFNLQVAMPNVIKRKESK